jgi:Ca2+-binding RTX toxin-like protein
MAIVTVTGANNSVVALSYDTKAANALATQLATIIQDGVLATKTITPAQGTSSPPPPVTPSGNTGLWVQTGPGTVNLSGTAYRDVTVADSVNGAPVNPSGSVILGSGLAGESILLGNTSVTFRASAGSGSVAGGGGDDTVIITPFVTGNWTITLGNGDDTVLAGGRGTQIIDAGGGKNTIVLGAGPAQVTLDGNDTVTAGSGAATITAAGDTQALVHGGAGNLTYVGGSEAATVFGGTGSDTFFGGKAGSDVFTGGTHQDTFVFGGANETVTGGTGTNTFDFVSGTPVGQELITNFTSSEQLTLSGYKSGTATVHVVGSSTVVTLGDNTKITLQNLTDPSIKITYT